MSVDFWLIGRILAGAIFGFIALVLVAGVSVEISEKIGNRRTRKKLAANLKAEEAKKNARNRENLTPTEKERRLRIQENLLLAELGRIRRNLLQHDVSGPEWKAWKSLESSVLAKLDELQHLLEP